MITISDNTTHEFKGDTTLSSIGANATVKIYGSLTVTGDIHQNAKIIIQSDDNNQQIFFGGIFINNINIANANNRNKLRVFGDVFSGVKITANCPLEFSGYLFSKVFAETKNASITAKDLDDSVILKTHNASIKADKTGKGCKIITSNGPITLKKVGQNSEIKTSNAQITIETVEKESQIKTSNAQITIETVENESEVKTSNAKIVVGHVAAHASLITSNNDIRVVSKDPSAILETSHGKIIVNNVVISEDTTHNNNMQQSFSLGSNSQTIYSNINIGRLNINQDYDSSSSSSRNIDKKKSENKNKYSEDLENYIKDIKQKKETYPEAYQRLGLKESDGLCCNITYDIPEIPVLLKGRLYDLSSLLNLEVDGDGFRKNPITGQKFSLNQLDPAYDIRDMIENAIKNAIKNAEADHSTEEKATEVGVDGLTIRKKFG